MKKVFYLICVFSCLLISCNKLKDFGNTNVNPTAVNTGNAAAFFTSSVASLPSTTMTPGIYVQYFMESQYPGTSYYSDNSSSFTGYYSGVLNYLQQIINLGYNGNATNNMVQVSKILQQYIYWQITNQWGDVPYSEALQGSTNTKPVYDDQESIYKNILTTVRASIDSMDGSTISGDISNYSGNVTQWKKMGNSLILLVSIQLSKVVPGANDYAAQAFLSALNNNSGVIDANSDNFTLVYPGNTYQNLWYTTYYSRTDDGESATMTDLMSSLSDPRQNEFGGSSTGASPNNTSSSLGLPYGVTRDEIVNWTNANPTYARILRGDFRQQTSEMPLIMASYISLIRAEAANLGWTNESVSSLYSTGIQLSFNYWGETMPSNYLTQSSVALGSENLKKIATQQYIAVYPNGLYAWNIWRKTNYPTLVPSINAANASGEIPRRLKYATSEATSNTDNYNAAIAKLAGGNSDVARMWWDLQ